ncbi:MAG TPA: dihydrolipoamide acetyltransferase family protein [Propionibacteriaceae bacterium]|nr:dihydrolipoamide acetyltransferase family protein [Propionibacteriaceae bacterium]
MAIREFRLPDPGEGLVEADIVTWRVAVGDTVALNDIVVEVETSKSLVELPSPYAGTVRELLVAEGDTVDVGAPIIAIDDGQGTSAEMSPRQDDMVPNVPETQVDAVADDSVTDGGAPAGRVSVLVGYGPKTTEAKRRPRKQVAASDAGHVEAHDQTAETFATGAPVSRRIDHREPLRALTGEAKGGPLPDPGAATTAEPATAYAGPGVLAKPPVRKLAKDLGVDLRQLTGSGPGGVITRDDVTAADAEMRAEPEMRPEPIEGRREDTRIPIKGVRKATAQAMVTSAFSAPHVSEWVTCDVSATVDLLERLKARREFAEVRLSPLLVIAKAVCLALQRTPELNSAWDEAAQEIVLKSSVNLGIAAATPRGLVVPNVKDAGSLSLVDLARAINDRVATAREGKTQPAEMSGGSFTITNIGVFGVDGGTPILNPGEAGILCVGQIARRPWVVGTGADERIEPRWLTTLALSFDHRLADGAQGSTFLANVAGILGDPGLALLF